MRIIQNDWQTYLDAFEKSLHQQDLSEKTRQAYLHDLSLFIRWLSQTNGQHTLTNLNEIDVIEYREYCIAQGLKASTINRRLGSISQLCRWAIDHDYLSKDITCHVKQINVSTKQSPAALSAKEVRLLLQATGQSKHGHAKRNYALIHLLLQTGLRVNEVAMLTLDDIVLNERSGSARVRYGKGLKMRTIPLNTKARRALQLYLKERESAHTKAIFISERKNPLTVRGIQAIVTQLAERAGLGDKKISPHTLRHTFAINYLKHQPTNIVELAQLLGHESLDTTAIYTKPSMQDLAQHLETMQVA